MQSCEPQQIYMHIFNIMWICGWSHLSILTRIHNSCFVQISNIYIIYIFWSYLRRYIFLWEHEAQTLISVDDVCFSSFFQSVCVLGYCVCPLAIALIICRIILAAATQTTILFVIRFLAVLAGFGWSTFGKMLTPSFYRTLTRERK